MDKHHSILHTRQQHDSLFSTEVAQTVEYVNQNKSNSNKYNNTHQYSSKLDKQSPGNLESSNHNDEFVLRESKNGQSHSSSRNQMNRSNPLRGAHLVMVTPVGEQVARAVRAILQHLGWKYIFIISLGKSLLEFFIVVSQLNYVLFMF